MTEAEWSKGNSEREARIAKHAAKLAQQKAAVLDKFAAALVEGAER